MQDVSTNAFDNMPLLPSWLDSFLQCFHWFLQHLDPSLFQSVILVILAIFIPFAIVFFADILNTKKETRSEFEKMVLSDEVFEVKKVFWYAVFGVTFFAFLSGTDISIYLKILSIIVMLVLFYFLWKPFKNILRFSEGHKTEFEQSFLKKLNLHTSFQKFM